MILYKGRKVILKHSGDVAEVHQILHDGMVLVRIDFENMIIPVAEDDLLPADSVPSHNPKEWNSSENLDSIVTTTEHKFDRTESLGLQLGFEAISEKDRIDKYRMYLINDTSTDLLFVFKVFIAEKLLCESDNILMGMSVFILGEISYDDVASMPEIITEVRPISTIGVGETITKILKIKAGSFFKSIANPPLLEIPVHHFILLKNFEQQVKKEKSQEEDLKSYTNRILTPFQNSSNKNNRHQHRKVSRQETEELAHFPLEIDLHIEKLSADYGKMTNGEIIRMQLLYFERYIDKACLLGVGTVFVIHGLGKGTLRDAIADRLARDQRVARFANDYHPRYGFGATEVVFV